jgi:hypothetical protein
MSSDSGLFSHSLLSWSIDDLPFCFTSIIVLSDKNSSRQCGYTAYDGGLCSILEDRSIQKLMFDCREDVDALKNLYNVRLDGILDVQLLEVMNRIRNSGYTTIRSLKHCLELFLSDKTIGIKNRSLTYIYIFKLFYTRP